MLKDQSILITGAAGQIGRFLVKRLCKLGFNVSCLDIKGSVDSADFNFLKADIRDKTSLEVHKSILKDVKVVVHLASVINNTQNVVDDAMASIEINVQGTLNLLEYLPDLQHICFASTYMVYGIPHSNPVNEVHPTNPSNIYGASKLIAEKFLQVYASRRNITLSILRFMGIYGPETPDGERAIPTFIKLTASEKSPLLFGTGKARRNHIYIDDAIDAILATLRAKKLGIFNIGGNDAPSNLELVALINDIMGKKVIPTFKPEYEEHDFILDISLAHDKIGFVPTVSMREGLKAEIDNWLATRAGQ